MLPAPSTFAPRASAMRSAPKVRRYGVPDAAGDILAEVLAGRVTLQAHDMVGDSPAMRQVYGRIRKLAPSERAPS